MADPTPRAGLFAYVRVPVPAGQPQEYRYVARLLQATACLGAVVLLPGIIMVGVMPVVAARRFPQGSLDTLLVLVPLLVVCGFVGMAVLASWVLSSVYAKWVRFEPVARNHVGQVAAILVFFGGSGLLEIGAASTRIPQSPWSIAGAAFFDAAMLVLGIAFLVLLGKPGSKRPFAAPLAQPMA